MTWSPLKWDLHCRQPSIDVLVVVGQSRGINSQNELFTLFGCRHALDMKPEPAVLAKTNDVLVRLIDPILLASVPAVSEPRL